MGQVTIYLDEETEGRMRDFVKSSGISLSKWLSNLIREKTDREWPEQISKLAGAWKDFPSVEEIRNSMGADYERDEV